MKKRILVSGYTNNVGGIEQSILNIYGQVSSEFIFDFICSVNNKPIALPSEMIKDGSKIYYFNTSVKRRDRRIKSFFKTSKEKYSTIIVNFGDLSDSIFLKYSKKVGIKKRIAYAHYSNYKTKNPIKKVFNFFFKLTIHSCATDFISYSNKATENTFSRQDWLNTKKYVSFTAERFAFNSIARKKIRDSFNIPEKTIVIGCVGSISENKNQIELVNALDIICCHTSYKLVLFFIGNLVGSPSYANDFAKIINKKRDYTIIHLQNIPNVSDYYSAFDLYISSSKEESFGLTILESFMSGIFPIVRKNSIQKELIEMLDCSEVDFNDTDFFLKTLTATIEKTQQTNKNRTKTFEYNTIDLIKLIREYEK